MTQLDLVVPAHNEQDRIDRMLDTYRSFFVAGDVRFVVALDGCVDRTADVVAAHRREDPRVELHEFDKLGKGGVLREAFRACTGDLVGFVDADGATPPAELARLADVAARADGAIANRWHPAAVLPGHRPMARRVASVCFARAARGMFGLPFGDTQCGAKVFRGPVLADLLPVLSERSLLFDVDLLAAAHAMGYQVVEVPTVWIDQAGSRTATHVAREAPKVGELLLGMWLRARAMPVSSSARTRASHTQPDTTAMAHHVH
ncbi:MAG: glycosyltransferase [Nocardioidaceae bacterium]